MSQYTIITILLCHYVFDFHFQTHDMAVNKSKCNIALSQHVGVYSLGVLLMAILNFSTLGVTPEGFFGFIITNIALHFLTDFVTSRATSPLFKEGNYHDGFCVVGADQVVHYICLFGTFNYFIK